ncbi:MAG: FKBP-type peptidyl-prolyl cis-trans isomerase [Bacteroidales bacterium]|nr:FKBP-type peptidyl-prolyl cis-trans isomerase [Bacteroidales bacterium]
MKTLVLWACAAMLALGAVSCGNKQSETKLDPELEKQLGSLKTAAEEGAEFIAAQLKADPALKKTKTGLVYKITEPGAGELFKADQTVKVVYTGKHTSGEVFDSSNGEAVDFPLQNVVAGFREMITMMRPGAKAYCIIPGDLAYGPQGNRGIAPNETLVFEIETQGLAE